MEKIYSTATGEELKPALDADGNQRKPAGTTFLKPPEIEAKQQLIYENDEWRVLPDHRGELFWSKETKECIEITELGIDPTTDDTLTALTPGPYDKWNSSGWEIDLSLWIENYIRLYRNNLITSTVWLRERHNSEKLLIENNQLSNTTFTEAQMMEWEIWWNQLRNCPDNMNYGDTLPLPPDISYIPSHIQQELWPQ